MKQKIKSNEFGERQAYVPASMKVMEITSRMVICQSGDINPLQEDNTYNDLF